MTENDYIAEYVKERHPGILGFDYAMWKAGRMMIKIGQDLGEVLRSIDWSEIDLQDAEGNADEQIKEMESEDK